MNKLFLLLLCTTSAFAQVVEKDSTANELQEVVVKTEKKIISNSNGNLKIDVASSIYKSVPDVLDLLSKLPKIQISANRESVEITGKGSPLIYIDNVRAELADLTSLSVDDIKTVEIIENPSAKYEAEGRAVLLITRKASRREGFQMVGSETASFKKKFNSYSAVNANLRTGKTEFRTNFSYNSLNPWESNANDYSIASANSASNYLVAGFTRRNQYVAGVSVLHRITDTDYFTVSTNGKFQNDDFRFATKTYNLTDGIENNLTTLGRNQARKNTANLMVGYNSKLSNRTNLFVGMRRSLFETESKINSENNYNETDFEPFRDTTQEFNVRSFSAKADLDTKIAAGIKLESGVAYSTVNAKTILLSTDFETGVSETSQYDLNEDDFSAYVQLSQNMKKITWSIGLRAEQTVIEGKYKDDQNPTVKKNYISFFPKGEIRYALDSLKTIQLNYAKSIVRPDFSSTSQGTTFINPYFVFTGNLDLNPALTDELSANFQYKDKSVKFSLYQTKDNMNTGFIYDELQQLLILRTENFDRESGFSLEFNVPLTYKFWTATNVFSINVNKIEDDDALRNRVKPFVYYYSNHSFNLERQYVVSVTGWGLSKRYQGILENNPFFIVDMAVSKAYKNWAVTLSANDVLRNMNFREKFNTTNVSTIGNYYTDTNEYAVSLKYTFGKIKPATIEEKSVDENADRLK